MAPRRPTDNRGAGPAEDGFYVVSPHDGGWALADCLGPSELAPGVSGERMARAGCAVGAWVRDPGHRAVH